MSARFSLLVPLLAFGVVPQACGSDAAVSRSDGGAHSGGQVSNAHTGGASGAGESHGGVTSVAGSKGFGGAAAAGSAGSGGDGGSGDGGNAAGAAGASGSAGDSGAGAAGSGAASGDGGNGGDSSVNNTHRMARILDVWPKEAAPGQALLIVGESLANVSIELNGQPLPAACSDGSCKDDVKLVALVPSDVTSGAGLLNASGAPPSHAVALHLVSNVANSPVAAPTQAFVPKFVDENLNAYPPISDRWMNECDLYDDKYFFSQTQTTGDFTFFSSPDDSSIQGTVASSTGIIRFSMGSADENYVGVFSTTILPYTLRIVAFPVHAGRQLVLLGCNQSKAQDYGSVCPSTSTGSASDFNGGPACKR